MTPRVPLPSDRSRTFGVPDERLAVPDPTELAPAVVASRDKCQAAIFALDALRDPVLVEMVRLRNARFQDCRFCQSTRSPAARASGATEDLYDQIDDYETSTLDARQKAALRLADAYLLRPGELSDDVRREALESFRTDEIVEIVLRLFHYSSDKVMVALRLDLDAPVASALSASRHRHYLRSGGAAGQRDSSPLHGP